MNHPEQIANHFSQLYFGGNWTCVDFKGTLADITWMEANTKLYSFNTIATLVYHTNYYVAVQIKVLRGEPLEAKDVESFNHPPITSEHDWQTLLDKTYNDAVEYAALLERLPADLLQETFVDEKYGSYYRNLHGVIEHGHYHLGQIVLLKKLLRLNANDTPR